MRLIITANAHIIMSYLNNLKIEIVKKERSLTKVKPRIHYEWT